MMKRNDNGTTTSGATYRTIIGQTAIDAEKDATTLTALHAERDDQTVKRAAWELAAKQAKFERDAAVARAEAAEGRYVALRQWFLNELPRSEIAPFGHIQHTTPEVVDQWCDKARAAITPPADLTQEKPHE
jgi:hypothetical protein